MQFIRSSILKHIRGRERYAESWESYGKLRYRMYSSNPNDLTTRVLGLVKNYNKLDAEKVTETADFQKDLSLDSLDRVELVMAIEQEFSIEIPDEKADNFTCCADIVKYIDSEKNQEITEDSRKSAPGV